MAEKTLTARIESLIRKCQKILKKLKREEAQARAKWNKGYQAFIRASEINATLKRRGTQREKKLHGIILNWRQETIKLTKKRDEAREAIKLEEKRMNNLMVECARLMEQVEAERKATDELVNQTFLLNDRVTDTLLARNSYLSEHVYCRLIDEEGNLRSQITFINSEETRKIIAMVNTIAIVLPDLAAEARTEIEKFFTRLQPSAQMDDLTKVLFDLTKKILVEKTKFKIGPDLYRFLSLELDKEIYPELRKAQELLKQSLRSLKTSSYIRLHKRERRTDNWEPVRQT